MEDCNPDYGYEGYDTEPVDINPEDTGTDIETGGTDNPEIGEIEIPVIDIPSPAEIEIHDGTGNLEVSDETLNKYVATILKKLNKKAPKKEMEKNLLLRVEKFAQQDMDVRALLVVTILFLIIRSSISAWN